MEIELLSEELKKELGYNNEEDIINSINNKKNKKKRKKEEEEENENKSNKKDKKDNEKENEILSKRAKKKLEQLEMKKIKEEKRIQYYNTIQKYNIEDDKRKLLISSRDMSNTSKKAQLKRAFYMHKAGLNLSDDVKELLFPEKIQVDRDSNLDDLILEESIPKKSNIIPQNIITPLIQPIQVQSQTNTDIKTNTKIETQNENQTTDTNTSIGSKLLMQFKKLHAIKGVEKPKSEDNSEDEDDDEDEFDEDDDDDDDEEEDEEDDESNESNDNNDLYDGSMIKDGPGYLPVEIELPIDQSGKILLTDENIQKSKKLFEENKFRKEKLKYILDRDPIIQAARLELPVCGMEQEIVESIGNNDVIILCGETGSGKSTQVPQFIYEAGYTKYGLIGVTQPRRVATVSTARRVAEEMGFSWDKSTNTTNEGEVVGYQIRYDSSTVGSKTAIKFMTDGILLKEVSTDLLLRKYSVIFLDEAHERNVNTDVLIGMLSRSIPLRKKQSQEEYARWSTLTKEEKLQYDEPIQPLRLIIMSATMRVSDFQNPTLFPILPPVIRVESRQYSVTTHFSRRTETENYLAESFKKACQIHKKLPAGGILIFLTGKQEILHMCRKLSKHLNKQKKSVVSTESIIESNDNLKSVSNQNKRGTSAGGAVDGIDEKEEEGDQWQDLNEEEMINSFINNELSDNDISDDDEDQISDIEDMDDDGDDDNINKDTNNNNTDDDEKNQDNIEENEEMKIRNELLAEALGIDPTKLNDTKSKETTKKTESNDVSNKTPKPDRVYVLPLFAMLSPEQQKLVFQPPPTGHRLIVVATNVAETSITIPGIRYVVDCGRQKERVIDIKSGISKYRVTWISKASADQRQGRAGRTGPGHSYRLYSSAFYDQHMKSFQEPEICTIPLEDLILQLKSIGIENEESFPFPTPPPLSSLRRAHTILGYLGALRSRSIIEKKSVSPLEMINLILNNEQKKENSLFLTSLGKSIAKFPINVRLAKMLIIAHKTGVLSMSLVSATVACVAERNPFLRHENNTKNLNIQNDNDSDDENDNDDNNSDENIDIEEKKKKDQYQIWQHPTSDILARLRALGAYSYCQKQNLDILTINNDKNNKKKSNKKNNKNSDNITNTELVEKNTFQLCEQLGLHHAIMTRCLDLQKQLYQLSINQFTKSSSNIIKYVSTADLLKTMHPPNEAEELGLRQIMLTGYCDSIARKAPLGSIEITAGMSRRKRLTAYLSCDPAVTTPIYIHPHSTLYSKDPTRPLPEYIIYNELVSNEKEDTIYMSGLTVINSSWIPELCRDCSLLQWSLPSEYPKPFYDAENDIINCYITSLYGAHRWELPPVIQPLHLCCERIANESTSHKSQKVEIITGYRKEDLIYRWFGRLLLEGKIIQDQSFQSIFQKNHMNVPLAIITEMKPNKQVSNLLGILCRDKIISLNCLNKKLQKNSSYLLNEFEAFFKPEYKQLFHKQWKLYSSNQ